MNINDAFPTSRELSGSGLLTGLPPNTQIRKVIELVAEALPLLAEKSVAEGIENEKGLNSKLSVCITNAADRKNLPYFSQIDPMEDERDGNSPQPDIGIYLKQDEAPLMVFECKRLCSKKRREYVVGHEDKGRHICCGGIERFKQSKHGRQFKWAGLIGYMQEGGFDTWLKQINEWISELALEEWIPKWSEEEKLKEIAIKDGVAEYSSIVLRQNGELNLIHLWVDFSVRRSG